jgi:hypothetical protein
MSGAWRGGLRWWSHDKFSDRGFRAAEGFGDKVVVGANLEGAMHPDPHVADFVMCDRRASGAGRAVQNRGHRYTLPGAYA